MRSGRRLAPGLHTAAAQHDRHEEQCGEYTDQEDQQARRLGKEPLHHAQWHPFLPLHTCVRGAQTSS